MVVIHLTFTNFVIVYSALSYVLLVIIFRIMNSLEKRFCWDFDEFIPDDIRAMACVIAPLTLPLVLFGLIIALIGNICIGISFIFDKLIGRT